MTTLKRIATLTNNIAGTAKVKLVVDQKGYSVKLTEVFGCRVPVTLLSRDFVNSSSTVDELFDRYLGNINIDNTHGVIVVNGTSGTHNVEIHHGSIGDVRQLVIKSSELDHHIVITYMNDTMRIMFANMDQFDHHWYPVSGTEITYYEFHDGEVASVSTHTA